MTGDLRSDMERERCSPIYGECEKLACGRVKFNSALERRHDFFAEPFHLFKDYSAGSADRVLDVDSIKARKHLFDLHKPLDNLLGRTN